MAFPASTATMAEALGTLRASATRMKSYATQANAALAASNQSANAVIQLMSEFQGAVKAWDAVASTPGLADYARTQYADAGLDIVAEFNAMRSAAVSVVNWVQSNFPKDASGYLLKDQFDAAGGLAVRAFTPAQTAGLRSALDGFIATVG